MFKLAALFQLAASVYVVLALPNGPDPSSFKNVHSKPNLVERQTSLYAPQPAVCPSSSLIRVANGVNSAETAYVQQRSLKAAQSFKQYLANTGATFPSLSTYPTLALATSGGGLRSFLSGAGVHQAFDAQDSNATVAGLYQAFTYESGLSGGAWLLSSISGNNWPTVSSLKTALWETAFMDTLLLPQPAGTSDAAVTSDIAMKQAAGFPITAVDPYGRLLSYQFFLQTDGGVAITTSSLAQNSKFVQQSVPFPIFSALGTDGVNGQCSPPGNATQYEFSPYEFGSWDKGVDAFVQIKYLGSNLTNGSPTVLASCVTGYDQQGFVLGTSSDIFPSFCPNETTLTNATGGIGNVITILDTLHGFSQQDIYALYPNPFYKYPTSSLVASQPELYLVDGGLAGQNVPIWPFLHRQIDALVVSDNSYDVGNGTVGSSNNYPNGTEIRKTYTRAKQLGLTRMPFIPSAKVFVSKGLNKKPVFFGCNDVKTMTIVYLPNQEYTFASGQATLKTMYTTAETDAMIANGVQIASAGGKTGWATCLACALTETRALVEGKALPSACAACFTEYCYKHK